ADAVAGLVDAAGAAAGAAEHEAGVAAVGTRQQRDDGAALAMAAGGQYDAVGGPFDHGRTGPRSVMESSSVVTVGCNGTDRYSGSSQSRKSEEVMQSVHLPRRSFLRASVALTIGAPFIIRNRAALAATSDTALPGLPYGIMAGDVGTDSAVIWSRSDR